MEKIQRINDIRIPIKIELRNIRKIASQQHGKDTYLYRFTIFINKKRLPGERQEFAHSIKELKSLIILTYF